MSSFGDSQVIVLEVDEQPAVQGTAKANAALERLEQTGRRASAAAEKAATSQADAVVRIVDRSRASIDRLVANAERKASFAGKSGGERLAAERDLLISKLQGEERAVARVTAAYEKLIAAESKSVGTGEKVVGALRNPLEAARGALDGVIGRFGLYGAAAAAAATATVGFVTGAFRLVKEVDDAGERIQNLADRTGLTVDQVDRLQAMARRAGVAVESLQGASRILADTLADQGTAGNKAFQALDRLGVSVFDATGSQRELGQVTLDVIEKLSRVTNSAERTALANASLGRGAIELAPLIKSYRELDQAVTSQGYGNRAALLEQIAQTGDRIDDLSAKWDILKGKLAGKLTAVVEITTRIVDVISGPNTDPTFRAASPNPSARDTAGLATQGGIPTPESLVERIRQFAEQQAAAIRGRDFAQRFANTVEGRQARLQDITREIADNLQKARAGVVGAEETLIRLNAEKAGLEAAIDSAKKQADLAKKLGALEVNSSDLIRGTARPAGAGGIGTPSLRRPGERVGTLFGANISGTFVSSEADRALASTEALAASQQQLRARWDGFAQSRTELDRIALETAAKELDFQARKIELLAGPGGERVAVEQITALRLEGLEKQKALGVDLFEIEQRRTEILQDREIRLLELQQRRFNSIRDQAGRVFDALIDDARSAGSVLMSILRTALLTPLREFATNLTATLLTGGRLSGGGGVGGVGAGGLFGRVLGAGGAGLAGAGGSIALPGPGGTGGFAGPVQSIPGAIGVGTQNGRLVDLTGLGGLGASTAGRVGLGGGPISGGLALGGALLLANGLRNPRNPLNFASGVAGGGLLGSQLVIGGQLVGAVGGAGIAGGALLAGYGLQRGGKSGLGLSAAGGALAGAAIGTFVLPGLGTLAGAAIGAAVGGIAGLVRMFIKTGEDRVIEKVRAVYGISIDRRFAKDPLLGIIRSSFGGNIDVGVRSPQVRELLELYSLAYGQSTGAFTTGRLSPAAFVQSGGSLFQQPTYYNGSPLPSLGGSIPDIITSGGGGGSSAPSEINVNVTLDAAATVNFLQGQTAQYIEKNPRAVKDANVRASRGNYNRLEDLRLAMFPGAVIS